MAEDAWHRLDRRMDTVLLWARATGVLAGVAALLAWATLAILVLCFGLSGPVPPTP